LLALPNQAEIMASGLVRRLKSGKRVAVYFSKG